jgi:hypothetical protein
MADMRAVTSAISDHRSDADDVVIRRAWGHQAGSSRLWVSNGPYGSGWLDVPIRTRELLASLIQVATRWR